MGPYYFGILVIVSQGSRRVKPFTHKGPCRKPLCTRQGPILGTHMTCCLGSTNSNPETISFQHRHQPPPSAPPPPAKKREIHTQIYIYIYTYIHTYIHIHTNKTLCGSLPELLVATLRKVSSESDYRHPYRSHGRTISRALGASAWVDRLP